jgi:hypothetical protein
MTTRDPASPAVKNLLSRGDEHLDRQGDSPPLRGKEGQRSESLAVDLTAATAVPVMAASGSAAA